MSDFNVIGAMDWMNQPASGNSYKCLYCGDGFDEGVDIIGDKFCLGCFERNNHLYYYMNFHNFTHKDIMQALEFVKVI